MNDTATPTWFDRVNEFVRRDPLSALLLAAIAGTLVYFFGIVPLFADRRLSAFGWAWQAWNPETNYEHAKLVPLVVLGLLWYDRKKFAGAATEGSPWGWLFLAIGLFLFGIGARTVQARFALAALPFTLFGSVLYLF